MASSNKCIPPSSILIIGSGVFGLSTAFSLSTNPSYKNTKITLIDRQPFPAPDGSSTDTSRIIRADYADPTYAALASEAQTLWRTSFGANARYFETGLCLTASAGNEEYVRCSLENVRALQKQHQRDGGEANRPILDLKCPEDIIKLTGTGGCSGTHGYYNPYSGWADAEAAMRYLHSEVEALDRVNFKTGTVAHLLFSDDKKLALGARLADGTQLLADLTIVAAGAWTPALLDMRGVATSTGQVLAYIPISDAEAETLSTTPVQLDFSNGIFIIPPPPPSTRPREQLYLKVARHGYGYSNPISTPHPEDANAPPITISLPYTTPSAPHASQPIPAEAHTAFRAFLASLFPPTSPLHALSTRTFSHTRICWYTDTPTGNWLISRHPSYGRSLLLATGGCGHAFKFLPVLGEQVVRVFEEGKPSGGFEGKWEWPEEKVREKRVTEGMVTEDGSRGGRKGMVLKDEMARGAKL